MSTYQDNLRARTGPPTPEGVSRSLEGAQMGAQDEVQYGELCAWCEAVLPEHVTGCRLGQSTAERLAESGMWCVNPHDPDPAAHTRCRMIDGVHVGDDS